MKQLFALFLLCFTALTAVAQTSNKAVLQEVYDKIKEAEIRHPEFVMAQCIQETGWVKCKRCCLRYNNLFGFMAPGNRCKKFSSWDESIAYYKTWQDKRYPKWRARNPKGSYYDFLRYVKYATNPLYNQELRSKVNWVKKNLEL